MLGLGEVDENELYTALDWLLQRHPHSRARSPAIETALAKRHLTNGTLVLYDVSSSYMQGRCCPLAKRGYSRDGRKGTLQIIYGLLCAADGCPVAIEVFDGNTADPMTLATQIDKLKQRFHLDHVVLVRPTGVAPLLPVSLAPATIIRAERRDDAQNPTPENDYVIVIRAREIRRTISDSSAGCLKGGCNTCQLGSKSSDINDVMVR